MTTWLIIYGILSLIIGSAWSMKCNDAHPTEPLSVKILAWVISVLIWPVLLVYRVL